MRAKMSVVAAVALTACGGDPTVAPRLDAAADVAADVVVDVPPPDLPPAGMSYTPDGCQHRVWMPDAMTSFVRDDRTTFGAAPAPLNVHVTWPADPTSVIAMLWRTDAATRATVVQYGNAHDHLDHTATGHVMTGTDPLGPLTQHEAHVCGLTADTTYYYRVGGEGHWSDVQSFKTAPAAGRTDYDVNFAVSGDSRDDFRIWRMTQERILSVSGMHQPDFEVFTGDAVALGNVQDLWDGWFDNGSPTQRLMPFVTAQGNHEGLAINYLMQFAQPQVGRVDQDELYFSFDYGPIHFVILNDTPYNADYEGGFRGTELAWLRADLTAHRARRAMVPWLIAVHHKSPYSSSTHSNDPDSVIVRNTLPPVYAEFGVDVVFNGHDHDFEVSKELDGQGVEVTAGHRGTTYYIAGGAGANLYPAGMRPWRRFSESVTNFLTVHVTPRALEVSAYRGDGTAIPEGHLSLTPRP